MMELLPQWYLNLPEGAQSMVTRLQNHRAIALLKFTEGHMSEDAARRIVAKCNARIEKIAKGAHVV